MGGSSFKGSFFRRKKKSPLKKAWSHLRGALPNKKHSKRNAAPKLNLDNLRKKKKSSQRRFSLPTDKKDPKTRFSLSNIKKKLLRTDSRGKKKKEKEKEKERGGVGKVGEQIKRKFSHEPKPAACTQHTSPPVDMGTHDEATGAKSGTKGSRMTLQEVMRSMRPAGSRSAAQKNHQV